MRAFAEELLWTPSYEIGGTYGSEIAKYHLAVEHGLENTAIISFVDSPNKASDISRAELRQLLSISYNNLVEWHVFVSEYDVRYVNNLSDDDEGTLLPVTRGNYERYLSSSYFEDVRSQAGRRKKLVACDDAVIDVISRWKRLLKADYANTVTNQNLSALFNALIFVRGCEDYRNRQQAAAPLLPSMILTDAGSVDLADAVESALSELDVPALSHELIDISLIRSVGLVDATTARSLFRDFYRTQSTPYSFNFALMSKHALSRIYERYVAILEFEADDHIQMSFLPPVPKERVARRTGAIYTPQFIAGFFARFIRENVTPRAFRTLRTLDPACGSGIFLRTLLEYQCDPLTQGLTTESIRSAFEQASGIDRDPNACAATRLSLALLHLVATGSLPEKLAIVTANAIDLALNGAIEPLSYDVIVANPPYIKFDHLEIADRTQLQELVDGLSNGRPDAYIGFLAIALRAVRTGGLMCLVLPHIFLQADNAAALRGAIARDFDVVSLVDLSAVRVFEGVGTYNVLLVAQKRLPGLAVRPNARVGIVREFAGAALQACLDQRDASTPYYTVFGVNQAEFTQRPWALVEPKERAVAAKIEAHPPLSQFLRVMQGMVTGDDETFIMRRELIPKGEEELFVPFLPDRMMRRYQVPTNSDQVAFYPFSGERALDADQIESRFPSTWALLCNRRARLSRRASVVKGTVPWWRPERPREPANMLRPKIVCPHLMLTPRFGLDVRGSFAVSRSPYIFDDGDDAAALKFALAVLNSSAAQWYMTRHAHRYGNGYYRVERPFLNRLPFPNPSTINAALLNEVLTLVDRRVAGPDPRNIDEELDEIVCAIYGLSRDETLVLAGRKGES